VVFTTPKFPEESVPTKPLVVKLLILITPPEVIVILTAPLLTSTKRNAGVEVLP